MNRKEFIKNTSIMTLGVGLSPYLTFGLGAKNTYKIGIIGAGISGLYLAKSLKRLGNDITILEASNSAGGRIAENTAFHSNPIDLGAQWIHGKNELHKIVKKSNTPIYEDTKNNTIKIPYKNSLLDDFPNEFYQFLKEVKKKTPLTNDLSVLDFAKTFNNDSNFLDLIESAITDAATKADNFSVNEISKMTNKLKTVDYQFVNTTMYGFIYKNYIKELENQIIYNFPVNEINYSKQTVVVSDNSEKTYEFDKLIITIPITELKSKKIHFEPELPKEKSEAFNKIGMDKGLKLFLKFEKQFYNHSIFNGKYAGYYIDPTKPKEQSLLASLIMGKKAENYYDNPTKATENYLSELDILFNRQASKYYIDTLTKDWGNEKYINGVYSYTMPGGQKAREIARKPIKEKIYFAGEAMNICKNYGNVHGAIESSMEVIKELR